MTEKKLKARIIHKHDTEVDWLKSSLVPKQGEIIVYDADENYAYERIKIGDGIQNVNVLPFVDDALRVELVSKIESTVKSLEDIIAEKADSKHLHNWSDVGEEPTGGDTIYWDGNVDGLECVMYDGAPALFKISSAVLNREDWANGCEYELDDGSVESLDEFHALQGIDQYGYMMVEGALFISSDNFDVAGLIVPTAGIWVFPPNTTNTRSVRRITVPGYTGFPAIKKIDKKYLPGTLIMQGTAIGAEKFNYFRNAAGGNYSHAEGYTTRATGNYSHSEGHTSIAQGVGSHAEGSGFADGDYSHAEGYETSATGTYSHAEGNESVASETASHAEGNKTEASGQYSHAEGSKSKAQAFGSHAEGFDTVSSGQCAHSEGYQTVASGYQSHAEGLYSQATAVNSHAEGKGTVAASKCQHVEGQYNIIDSNNKYAHIVGNGTKEDVKDEQGNITTQNRSNAHTIDWNGNAWFAGEIRVGGTCYDDAVSLLPKRTSVTLSSSKWTGNSNPWKQDVVMNGVTANSKIDLQPTATQIVELQNADIALIAENDNGVVTVYAIGGKPTKNYTMQALITEVISV